jgi:hypothetical protein
MDNAPNFKSQPINQNLALPTRFSLVFARLPEVTFYCQTVILPGVSTSYAISPTPFVDQKVPGDKSVYESLSVTFLLDEDLKAYREVMSWIRGYTFPTDFSEYRNLGKLSDVIKSNPRPQYSDCHVNIYNSTWQHILTYKFYDAFPTSLGQIAYSAADTPDTTMMVDMTIDYQWFDIIAQSGTTAV